MVFGVKLGNFGVKLEHIGVLLHILVETSVFCVKLVYFVVSQLTTNVIDGKYFCPLQVHTWCE